MTQNKPDFLIVGAAKSGTTWLQNTLNMHPDITIPQDEIHYFSRFYDKWSWDKYLELFAGINKPIKGENSNPYLNDASCAARIRSHLPDIKIIIILRNPVERAYSSYCMQIDRGRATQDIDKYMSESSPLPHILQNGLYYEDIKRYFDLYKRENIAVFLFDDIKNNPQVLYNQITDFLSTSRFAPENLTKKFNEKGNRNLAAPVARLSWILNHSPLAGTRFFDVLRAHPLSQFALKLFKGSRTYPPLSDTQKIRLKDYFINDINKVETLAGINLSNWKN